jgi:hypothetical protein
MQMETKGPDDLYEGIHLPLAMDHGAASRRIAGWLVMPNE